jgi:hypothetical protein
MQRPGSGRAFNPQWPAAAAAQQPQAPPAVAAGAPGGQPPVGAAVGNLIDDPLTAEPPPQPHLLDAGGGWGLPADPMAAAGGVLAAPAAPAVVAPQHR